VIRPPRARGAASIRRLRVTNVAPVLALRMTNGRPRVVRGATFDADGCAPPALS